MTRFASFIANQQDGQTPVSINPARVVAVIAVLTPNGRASEFSAVEVGDRVIEVVGSVAEVVAALESATATPAQGVQDMEGAARVLLLLADAVANCDEGDAVSSLTSAIATALGSLDKSWGGAVRGLERVAAKLRGGG